MKWSIRSLFTPGILLPAAVAVATVSAYVNSFDGVFMFDDQIRITCNPSIRSLSTAALHSTRPLVALTLHLNHALGGYHAPDYHLFNLAVHVGSALLLFGAIFLTLKLHGPCRRDNSAAWYAAAAACLWAVHPLNTESVTYIIQRSESMMGFFYLLSLYLFIAGRNRSSVIACALGMACKPAMVTAPLAILLYDRTFVSGTFRQALKDRPWFYAGLTSTWLILAALLSMPHESAGSAGLGAGFISPWRYLATQPGVILHYLLLVFRPVGLCMDLAWPAEYSIPAIVAQGASVFLLLSIACYGLSGHRSWGYPMTWFFLVLAPTSGFIPIADNAAEHRMYLALAGPVTTAVLAAGAMLNRAIARNTALRRAIGSILAIGTAILLAYLTIERNRDYNSEERMALNIISCRPGNFRAYTRLVTAYISQGSYEKALAQSDRLLERTQRAMQSGDTRYNISASHPVYYHAVALERKGAALLYLGSIDRARACFEESIRLYPGQHSAHHNLAVIMLLGGNIERALQSLEAALQADPDSPMTLGLSGTVLAKAGRHREATDRYLRAMELDPDNLTTKSELAWLLATCPDPAARDGARSLELADSIRRAVPADTVRTLDILAAALAECGRYDEAAATARHALALARRVPSPSAKGTDTLYGPAGIDDIAERLRLYETQRPFRLNAGTGKGPVAETQ